MRVTDQDRDEIKTYATLHNLSVTQTLLGAFKLMVKEEQQSSR